MAVRGALPFFLVCLFPFFPLSSPAPLLLLPPLPSLGPSLSLPVQTNLKTRQFPGNQKRREGAPIQESFRLSALQSNREFDRGTNYQALVDLTVA